MKYKKGDIIKVKEFEVMAKFGQIDSAYYGQFGVVEETGGFFIHARMFKFNLILDLEEIEISHKIKDNKLNRKLYKEVLFENEKYLAIKDEK